LLAYEVIEGIARAGTMQHKVSLAPGPDSLQDFWKHALEEPWGQAHPALRGKSPSQLSSTLPLLFHTDGHSWKQGVLTFMCNRFKEIYARLLLY
jgi:hypothetical protein